MGCTPNKNGKSSTSVSSTTSGSKSVEEELMQIAGDVINDTITPQGLSNLVSSISLNNEKDVEVLVLLYLCESKDYGQITRDELKKGLKKLNVKNISQWNRSKERLTEIAKGENEEEFAKFHAFVFEYHLLQPGKKTLTREEAEVVLNIEFARKYPVVCGKFLQFFKESQYRAINRDQWKNMLEVFHIIATGDTYDVNGPTIFDDFYYWLEKNKKLTDQ